MDDLIQFITSLYIHFLIWLLDLVNSSLECPLGTSHLKCPQLAPDHSNTPKHPLSSVFPLQLIRKPSFQLVAQAKKISVILVCFLSQIPHNQYVSKSYWLYYQNVSRICPLLTIHYHYHWSTPLSPVTLISATDSHLAYLFPSLPQFSFFSA